jgi:hypothetical protein
MEELFNYVFHYNPHSQVWSAIPRDEYVNYWNGVLSSTVIKSKELSVLMELLSRGEDFINSVSEES